MAIFGRETEAERQRALRITAWLHARPGGALISPALGMLSVIDCWTLVVGVIAGIAAIVIAILTLRGAARLPGAAGRKLCIAGLTLGVVGLCGSIIMMTLVYPWLSAH